MRFVSESRDTGAGRTDYPGAMLATAGLGALTYALTRWSASGQAGTTVWICTSAGVALLAAFLFTERQRRSNAMMPLGMFANRCFSGLNLMTFLLYGAFGAAMLLIPYVLISAAGYSPVQAGLALLPLPIIIALASPAMGGLAARIGPRLPLTLGPLIVAAGMLIARHMGSSGSYWTSVFPTILVLSVGMSGAVAPLTSSVLGSVDERHVGTASGFNSAVARIGGGTRCCTARTSRSAWR